MASPNNIAKLPRIKPGRRGALAQALEMQARLMADIRSNSTTPTARAQLARAWDCLEERKRILRNRPLPGSLKPETPKRKRDSVWEMDGPLEDAPDCEEAGAIEQGGG